MIHSEHYKKYTIFDKKYIKTQYNNQKLKYSQKFSIKSQVCVQKNSVWVCGLRAKRRKEVPDTSKVC
jgi:hypothetical protein